MGIVWDRKPYSLKIHTLHTNSRRGRILIDLLGVRIPLPHITKCIRNSSMFFFNFAFESVEKQLPIGIY